MRSDCYHSRAKRQVTEYARRYSDRFETDVLSNAAYDAILQDELAVRLADVVHKLDDLSQRMGAIDEEAMRSVLDNAMYSLDADEDVVRSRVETVVEEELQSVAESIDDWDDDRWNGETKEDVKRELAHVLETGEALEVIPDA